jgi:hypothetical protein
MDFALNIAGTQSADTVATRHLIGGKGCSMDGHANDRDQWREKYWSEVRRERLRKALRRAANILIGVAAGGVPWSIYNFNGYGPSVMFGCFVLYLILMDFRARI